MCIVWGVSRWKLRIRNEEQQSVYRCPCLDINHSYSLRSLGIGDVLCFRADTKVRVLEGLLNNTYFMVQSPS